MENFEEFERSNHQRQIDVDKELYCAKCENEVFREALEKIRFQKAFSCGFQESLKKAIYIAQEALDHKDFYPYSDDEED